MHPSPVPSQLLLPSVVPQVTTEDGGRLNAFATEPRMEVVEAEPTVGVSTTAPRKLNGRMAMLGFIALLATELALGGESFVHGLLGLG